VCVVWHSGEDGYVTCGTVGRRSQLYVVCHSLKDGYVA